MAIGFNKKPEISKKESARILKTIIIFAKKKCNEKGNRIFGNRITLYYMQRQ